MGFGGFRTSSLFEHSRALKCAWKHRDRTQGVPGYARPQGPGCRRLPARSRAAPWRLSHLELFVAHSHHSEDRVGVLELRSCSLSSYGFVLAWSPHDRRHGPRS